MLPILYTIPGGLFTGVTRWTPPGGYHRAGVILPHGQSRHKDPLGFFLGAGTVDGEPASIRTPAPAGARGGLPVPAGSLSYGSWHENLEGLGCRGGTSI
jgi:hypothetical protein